MDATIGFLKYLRKKPVLLFGIFTSREINKTHEIEKKI
jgi:uncharacterized protein YhhL (DUF1145 family)